MNNDIVTRLYTSGKYSQNNPDWDVDDSPWKAERVASIIDSNGLSPLSITEIGCGAGAILSDLKSRYPSVVATGYDIALGLPRLWEKYSDSEIHFVLGDYFDHSEAPADLVLVLDVIEHLSNPFDFLDRLRGRCKTAIFHFPLDLSASSVIREKPLLHVRRKVGHLHYYTRGLVMALLDDCGFDVIEAKYTGAGYTAPNRSSKTRLVGLIRRVTYALFGDLGVRLLGGETLMVLARPKVEL